MLTFWAGSVAGYDGGPSALLYVFWVFCGLSQLCPALGVMQSLRLATAAGSDGGLALLGVGVKEISQEAAKSLATWRLTLFLNIS